MKRFNCVNNKWVKSQKAVHFPFENFDPTPYLAAIPQETILRHRELRETRNARLSQSATATMPTSRRTMKVIDDTEKDDDNNKNIIENGNPQEQYNNIRRHTGEMINGSLDNLRHINTPKKLSLQQQTPFTYDDINCNINDTENYENHINSCERIKSRQRLISTSLDKSPIIDNEFQDFHEHKLKSNEDKFDPKYKLYAVVVSE